MWLLYHGDNASARSYQIALVLDKQKQTHHDHYLPLTACRQELS